jgi:probable F420-dependent oxidoreductase
VKRSGLVRSANVGIGMKFGVCIPNYGCNLSKPALVESAQLAEALKFNSVWTTDHTLVPKKYEDPYGSILDCLVTLAYVGAVTKEIQLGTSVLVLPMRNPITVAKQAASIDYLTGGRLILGMGVGWMEEEFDNLATSFHDRGKRFEEAIEMMRALYRNKIPQFQGQYYKFTDATFKPTMRDGPEVWFGGNSRSAIRRAARSADGWHPVGMTVEAYSAAADTINSILPAGREFTMSLRILIDLGGKAEAYQGSGGEPRSVIAGNQDQVINTIERYREAGLSHLACYFGDIGLELLKKKMKQFAAEVLPSFER